MADTHEEQLLTDLLGRIACEDARLDAPHLESRVIVAVAAPSKVRLKADTTHYLTAAAIAMAVLVPAIAWLTRDIPVQTTELTIDAREAAVAVAETTIAVSPPPSPAWPRRSIPSAQLTPAANPSNPTNPTNPTNPANPANPSYSRDEFMPLMPLTERELAGPFQIVRVQMPLASLGTLRSPLEHPNEVIEADVLLGEDGMARAIRVSTGGSVYPWRSR